MSLMRTYRRALGLSQSAFAAQLNVPLETYRPWDAGRRDCSATEAAERVLLQIGGQGIQPVCGVVASGVINFPPRNESLDFLVVLDTYYADELNRSVELSYIDLEGKAVWLQEHLRYRVNGCNDQEATDRVFQQIRGGGIAPICST